MTWRQMVPEESEWRMVEADTREEREQNSLIESFSVSAPCGLWLSVRGCVTDCGLLCQVERDSTLTVKCRSTFVQSTTDCFSDCVVPDIRYTLRSLTGASQWCCLTRGSLWILLSCPHLVTTWRLLWTLVSHVNSLVLGLTLCKYLLCRRTTHIRQTMSEGRWPLYCWLHFFKCGFLRN